MDNKFLILSDNRKLGYSEWGDPSGYPIIGLHGTPGSRIWFEDDDPVSKRLGIRLITVDRPGYGLSDPKPNRTILEFNDDLFELKNHLNLKEFSIFGVSGGGPYALACGISAHLVPGKIGLIASMSEFANGKIPKDMCRPNRIAFYLAKRMPWLLRFSFNQQKRLLDESPDVYLKSAGRNTGHLCESDRTILRHSKTVEGLLLQMKEAFRQGVREPVKELRILLAPWNIDYSKITGPVKVWHGDEDTLSPISSLKEMIEKIPMCNSYFKTGKGHFLDEDEKIWEEIITKLIG